MKNKSKLKESHEFKEKKRYVYDSFINQKHDSNSNEFKPIKIKNIAIEPFSLAPSYKLFVNKTTSILKNRKKRLYKVDSESTAVEIKQDKGKEENSNEVTENTNQVVVNADLEAQSPVRLALDCHIFNDQQHSSFLYYKPFTPKCKESITVRKFYKEPQAKRLKTQISNLQRKPSALREKAKKKDSEANKVTIQNSKNTRKDLMKYK